MADGQGFARRVTLENLESFAPLLKRPSTTKDDVNDVPREEQPDDPALQKAEALFKGKSIKVKKQYTYRPPQSSAEAPPKIEDRPIAAEAPKAAIRGRKIWQISSLPRSSAQRQEGHPTGGIRLVQGDFKGQIDQTTYFRDEAFGAATWHLVKTSPRVEEAEVTFRVKIDGEDLGNHTLTVSHKPSGEASQNNYTTILKWGDLSEYVRIQKNVVGKTLAIYAPSEGDSTYLMEIS